MTQAYHIAGRGSVLSSVLRGVFLVAAAIGGFFLLAVSAAFAFFVVAGLVLVGVLAFTFFWGRAKILGRPFGPKAQFEAAKRDMEAQMRAQNSGRTTGLGADKSDGPIIDAHQTPHGWSVDD